MKQYHDLLSDVLSNGLPCADRTGVGTRSVFGRQIRFDLSEGFPLLTSKKVPFRAVLIELLWFLKGSTNVKWLQDRGVSIWDEWAGPDGDLGPIYGAQWRSWIGVGDTIDQIAGVINTLKMKPFDRGHIVSAWNVGDLGKMALRPCHTLFQFHVDRNYRLSCQLYQRSADLFLGVPFNIASYALLTHMIAEICQYEVGEFVHTFGDAHIYNNHVNQVEELLSRTEYPKLPTLVIEPGITDIDKYKVEHFRLLGYHPLPAISAPVAV